jgi:hypothetical protein
MGLEERELAEIRAHIESVLSFARQRLTTGPDPLFAAATLRAIFLLMSDAIVETVPELLGEDSEEFRAVSDSIANEIGDMGLDLSYLS